MALDPLYYTSGLLIAAVLAFVIVIRRYQDKLSDLREEVRQLSSSKQSLATTYGRITEQWAPFMTDYPHDPQQFRFLGSPVDGVQFDEDKVVFVEFKTNQSRLSPTQERIKRLVQEGRVEWLEFRMAGDAPRNRAAAKAGPSFAQTGAERDDV